jgi:hypothetical protein
MSTSVLRRYTPPTCTLEIAATGSVLSRWTDRTVLKNLRFQLNFDDPTLPPEKQVTIRGDRPQLESLCDVVEAYVQSVLNQTPEQFHQSVIRSDASPNPGQLLPLRKATGRSVVDAPTDASIHLKPKGLLGHELHLGSLISSESTPSVSLSTLQLFDLANALDEYRAEALSLPALSRPAWLKTPTDWTKVAAVLVLALGATGAVTKFVMDISSPVPQVASSEAGEVETSAVQRSDIATRLPVPSSGAPSDLDLNLQTQFPPKPPTEALRPEGVAELPPVGVTTVPADQFATAQPSEAPATLAPEDGAVILVPSEAPSDEAAIAQAPLADPLANTLPADPNLPSTALVPSLSADARVASAANRPEAFSQQELNNEAQLAAASSTAFDTYPQVAEIRNYFLQNWQPPAEMTQPIQYRLQLNPNGSIRLITPMGTASEQFVDRTNMPLMDEPFVSPLDGRDNLQVRLVLSPDGRVQVFPDGN